METRGPNSHFAFVILSVCAPRLGPTCVRRVTSRGSTLLCELPKLHARQVPVIFDYSITHDLIWPRPRDEPVANFTEARVGQLDVLGRRRPKFRLGYV